MAVWGGHLVVWRHLICQCAEAGFCNLLLSRDFAFPLFSISPCIFLTFQSVGCWITISCHVLVLFFLHIFVSRVAWLLVFGCIINFLLETFFRREGDDVMVQMLTVPFIVDNKCPLPLICDKFHRQKTFCTKDFLFCIPSWFLILYLFTFLSFCLIP